MTDAFRCDGCDDYYPAPYRLVSIEVDTTAVDVSDITLDDLGPDVWGVLEPAWDGENEPEGDYCPTCGLEVLGDLIDRYGGDDE